MDVKIFSTLETDDLTQKQNCFNVISLWILSASGKGRFHTGMIFCRYLTLWNGNYFVFWAFTIYRFCYVRFANGLVKEGVNLLHFLFCVVIFLLNMSGVASWVGTAWWQETGYTDIVKGKFCNKESVLFILGSI